MVELIRAAKIAKTQNVTVELRRDGMSVVISPYTDVSAKVEEQIVDL